jgi:SAM-dependent methyltransferase
MLKRNSQNTVTARDLRGLLTDLFAEQLAKSPSEYLQYHAADQAISSHVNCFLEYRRFLPDTGRVLDWGCHHAPDAAMIRLNAGVSAVSITGCDFLAPQTFPVFWNFSDLDFVQLNHTVRLPFEDESFDCVIGGGALEHAAQDYESLKELYRILKPGGRLIITHLPNRFSVVEFVARNIRKSGFHRRLYSASEISTLLKRSGFYPHMVKRHRLLPSNKLRTVTGLLSRFEPLIERIWPLNLFCADILAVAEKVSAM